MVIPQPGRPAAVHYPGVRPCKRGEPAAVPYPGVRPRKRGRPAHALLACAAGLRRHLIPASGRPPCGSVSAAGRRLYIAPACGRASVPYPGVRPRKRGRPAHALLACAAGLRRHLIPCERGEPAAVPYPGVRPCKRGRPAAVPYAGLRRPATCCTGLFERGGS